MKSCHLSYPQLTLIPLLASGAALCCPELVTYPLFSENCCIGTLTDFQVCNLGTLNLET